MAKDETNENIDEAPVCVGLAPYARAFVAFLRRPAPAPRGRNSTSSRARSISIEGGWGIGKTTFTDLVTQELRAAGVPVVTFRPWIHTQHDDLWAALATTFHRELKHQLPRRRYAERMLRLRANRWFKWGLDRSKFHWSNFFLLMILPLGLAAFMTGCVISIGPLEAWRGIAGFFASQSGLLVAILTGAVALVVAASKLAPLLDRWLRNLGRPATPPLVSRLEGDFADLVSALCPKGDADDRAVIFIDDLDRCTALGVAETLRALGVLINEDCNVTVVMAIDRDRVAAALASEDSAADYHRRGPTAYRNGHPDDAPDDGKLEAVRHGHHFLEKFIEATFRLPGFSDEHARVAFGEPNQKSESPAEGWDDPQHLQNNLSRLGDYLGLVLNLFESNPRRLHLWQREVYLSLLTLSALGRVTTSDNPVRGTISVRQIAQLQALFIVWPRFFGDLRRHPLLLAWLTAYVNAGEVWPPAWGLGVMDDRRRGSDELRYWIKELRKNQDIENLFRDESSRSANEAFIPSLIELDAALLLELQYPLQSQDHLAQTPPPAATENNTQAPAQEAPADAMPVAPEGPASPPSVPEAAVADAPEASPQAETAAELGETSAQAADLDTVEGLRALVEQANVPANFEKSLTAALKSAERALQREGPSSGAFSRALNSVGNDLRQAGRYPQAQRVREQELSIGQRLHGEEHPDVATSMNNLARVMQDQGELQRARELHEKTLELRRRLLGEEHPDVATSMSDLARVMHEQGELQRARELHEKTLELRRRLHGEEHPAVATSMSDLARVMHEQGEYQGARELHEKTLELYRQLLGEEHPYVTTSMNNLASVMHVQGELQGARDLHEKTLELYRQLLGEEHPYVATSMNNLARVMQDQGELQRARELHEKTLELRRRLLGEEH
ncbi:MAG: tetratricopeptide repeat protein, partial [Pseudomonadota bacterium]